AANRIEEVRGSEARLLPGYRNALIGTAVCINAAHTAFALRQEVETAGLWEIEVLFGVYNLFNHQVSIPNNSFAPASDENVCLAHAPSTPCEFHALAVRMAEILRPIARRPSGSSATAVSPVTSSDNNGVIEASAPNGNGADDFRQ